MNETPTPRTDNHARAYQTAGMPAAYTVILSHARQLERELNNSIKIQDGMAMTILSLQAERDQLRKVIDEFAIPYVLERETK